MFHHDGPGVAGAARCLNSPIQYKQKHTYFSCRDTQHAVYLQQHAAAGLALTPARHPFKHLTPALAGNCQQCRTGPIVTPAPQCPSQSRRHDNQPPPASPALPAVPAHPHTHNTTSLTPTHDLHRNCRTPPHSVTHTSAPRGSPAASSNTPMHGRWPPCSTGQCPDCNPGATSGSCGQRCTGNDGSLHQPPAPHRLHPHRLAVRCRSTQARLSCKTAPPRIQEHRRSSSHITQPPAQTRQLQTAPRTRFPQAPHSRMHNRLLM